MKEIKTSLKEGKSAEMDASKKDTSFKEDNLKEVEKDKKKGVKNQKGKGDISPKAIVSAKENANLNEQQRNKAYNKYVNAKIPKTRPWPTLFNSFWVGGLICVLGQGINDLLLYIFPNISEQSAWAYTLIILIFIASLLTGIGVYDKLGKFAGGGTIVPITGFSNSITSPSVEFKSEGIVYGICVKMFTIAGPVIVFGILSSALVGLIYYIVYSFI